MKRLAAILFGLWALIITAAVVAPEYVSIDGLFRAERDAGPIEAQAADTKISALSATTSYECSAEFPAAFSSANEKWTACQVGGATRLEKTANYTVVEADRAKSLVATSGSFTLTYTAAATLGAGWWQYVSNEGTGIVTLDGNASETIAGKTTYPVENDESFIVLSDGTNLQLVPLKTHANSRKGFRFYTELDTETSATAAGGMACVESNTGTGAATTTQAIDSANHPTIVRSTTGTTATGRASLDCVGITSLALGSGTVVYEAGVNITTLSTSAERYQLVIGLRDSLTAANQVDGAYILYDEGGVSTGSAASANWQCVTASNSTRTFTTSATAVTAAAWHTIRIEVDAAGTSVGFFVDGTSICTAHTTNIPTGTARALGAGTMFLKSVGTTARTLDLDYILTDFNFTTFR